MYFLGQVYKYDYTVQSEYMALIHMALALPTAKQFKFDGMLKIEKWMPISNTDEYHNHGHCVIRLTTKTIMHYYRFV